MDPVRLGDRRHGHHLPTDYIQPADEEQVWSIWEGNARVKR